MICHRDSAYTAAAGGRPGATKVMVVVTDGESHDGSMLNSVIAQCNEDNILRFGIAVRRSSPVGWGGGRVGGKRSPMSSPPKAASSWLPTLNTKRGVYRFAS